MPTSNAVPTKKLKTGKRVKLKHLQWAVVSDEGRLMFLEPSREGARWMKGNYQGSRIVRLNPITGVVSK